MKKLLSIAFAVTVMASAAMAQRVSDLKPGDRVPLSQRHPLILGAGVTLTLKECLANNLFSKEKLTEFEMLHELQMEAIKNGVPQLLKGCDPSILSITGSMAFYTVGIDSIATYFDYLGSTSPFDQCGFQIGKASASMFDTTMTQYVTANPQDQLVFVRKNLLSGVQYRFKFFVFDATAGTVTFYPSGNLCYYATTIYVASASLSNVSFSCPKKKLYFYRNNNGTAIIQGRVDTSNFNSSYMNTFGVISPQSRTATINGAVLDSIDLSSNMVSSAAIVNYQVWLSISIGSTQLDTIFDACAVNTTDVDEIAAARKAFKLFPNPNPTTVESAVAGIFDILDLTGRVVSSEDIAVGQTVLSKKEISSGLYFYRFSNMKGEEIVTDKIIVIK